MFNSCLIWALTRENLSLGFLTKRDSNQSPQLQKLDRVETSKKIENSVVASSDMILSDKRITKALSRLHDGLHLCCSQTLQKGFLVHFWHKLSYCNHSLSSVSLPLGQFWF